MIEFSSPHPKVTGKGPPGGQHMTTEGLIRVGNVGLAFCESRDLSHLWLVNLSDMSSRSQWRFCTFSLALSS